VKWELVKFRLKREFQSISLPKFPKSDKFGDKCCGCLCCVYGGAFRPIGCRKQLLEFLSCQRVDKPKRWVYMPTSGQEVVVRPLTGL